jgi:hypothetical protein
VGEVVLLKVATVEAVGDEDSGTAGLCSRFLQGASRPRLLLLLELPWPLLERRVRMELRLFQ